MNLGYTMHSHGIFQSYPTVFFTIKSHWRMGSPSRDSIIMYTAHTHQSNICIRRDESKILFEKHIPGIFLVYTWNIHGKGIYLVYTRKILSGDSRWSRDILSISRYVRKPHFSLAESYIMISVYTSMSENYHDTQLARLGTVYDLFIMFEYMRRPGHLPWQYIIWWSRKWENSVKKKYFGY